MISVVIPSYNSENTIGLCIDSLIHQSYQGEYEVIVVDSSSDNTPRVVSGAYPQVKLIHIDNRTDPGTARNIGIGEAKGEIIAFTDSDCIPLDGWLESIAAVHMSQPQYKIIGGVIRNGNESDDSVGLAGYLAEFREFLPGQSKREVVHIPTCNISFKRQVFKDYGPFQGEYYPQEDLVYNYSLVEKGEKILLDPTIEVFHNHRSRLREFLMHQWKIGGATSRVLRTVRLPGSSLARHPFLNFVPILFVPAVKFVRTVKVFLRLQPRLVIGRPMAVFIFAFGLVAWTAGFFKGAYSGRH
jgi:glycosyltransferase involved in cell wall biosynthesis